MRDYKNLTDEQLIEIVRSKDKELYAEIIKRYKDRLLRYAQYLLLDREQAADVVQEAFIKAYINLHERFDFKSEEDVQDDLIKKELEENLQACLENMPVIYKEPLVLYYLDGKSYDQISEILRIPEKTVATRLRRAKSLLKKICQRKKVRL